MPRPPHREHRPRSVQKFLVETVLFVSVFTLIGHLSVNFWERYMIQSEITKVKSSLYAMKDTINTIGIAYDNLHTELLGLSLMLEPEPTRPEQENKPKSKSQSTLDRKAVNDLEVQVMDLNKAYNEQKIGTAPFTINQTTQHFLQELRKSRGATCLHRRAKDMHDKNEKTVRVIPKPDVKDAATIRRYPLKSAAVGEVPTYDELFRIHEENGCDDDTCGSGSDFWWY